jgi:hypothetical protein
VRAHPTAQTAAAPLANPHLRDDPSRKNFNNTVDIEPLRINYLK